MTHERPTSHASDGIGQAPSDARHRAMIARARDQVAAVAEPLTEGTTAAPRPPAELIDGYDLLEELHRGGQGVVYRAVQRSTNRVVAIKVLVHGAFASLHERHRFEREVELLARLNVPGIVRIVDSGVSSGRWWFAMDLIEGAPLDRVPRERQGLVRLFIRIAEALHAAHLRGIIHRDLKPRNILVDRQDQPHLLDFGLAHAQPSAEGLTAATITEPGQFVGSLPWASPEQVLGGAPIDIRTDIYSLGVLLYQLLTDRFPYRVVGPLHEITKAIAHDDPIRPSAVDATIDRDLETIVLTCLRKDPSRRYQSAAALAGDLAAYLRGEPLAARRDSLAYVLRLWFARHRLAASLAAASLVSLVGATALALTLWQRAATAQARAESEAITSAATLRFLERTIASADPGRGSGPSASILDVMEQAKRELEANAGRDDPLVEAAACFTLGHVLYQLGRFEEASELAERSLALRERTLPSPHVELGRSLVLLSTIRRQQGHGEEALRLSEQAIATLRAAHHGSDHRDLAAALVELAWANNRAGEPDEAGRSLREAIAMLERIAPADDEQLLTARLNLMLLDHGSTSIEACDALVGELRSALGPYHESAITGAKLLSAMQAMQGDVPRASATLSSALDATRRVYGPRHPLAIDTLLSLASLAGRSEGPDAACELLLPERENARLAYGDTGLGWAQYQRQLGSYAFAAGRPEAEEWTRAAIATFAANGAPPGTDVAAALIDLALLTYRKGDLDASERAIRECLSAPKGELPPRHWTQAQATALLGQIELDRDHLEAAESLLLEADQALRREPARNRRAIAGTARALATLYERWIQVDASDERRAALERWRREASLLGESDAR